MKKNILIFTTVVGTVLQLNAQVVITRADYGQPGDTVYYERDLSVTGSIGAGGTNQAWDFKTGISADLEDIVVFHDASFDANAPAATNLIIETKSAGNNYQYLDVSSERAKLLLDQPEFGLVGLSVKMLDFPMEYGKAFADSFHVEKKGLPEDFGYPGGFIDSGMLIVDVYLEVECDAWGTLETPSGEFNVLRVRNKGINNIRAYAKGGFMPDSVWTLYEPGTSLTAFYSYDFMGRDGKSSIAEAITDSMGVIEQFSYTVAGPATGLNTFSQEMTNVSVYPNPANEKVNVSFENSRGSRVSILLLDINGKTVKSGLTYTDQAELDVASLDKGIYFCRISGGEFVSVRKVVICK